MCEDFLESIREVCHQVVVSDPLQKEWDDHNSNWALIWRRKMENSKEEKVSRPAVGQDAALRHTVKGLAGTHRVTEEIEKDIHLVEACREGDLIVASGDKRARRGFASCASSVDWLGEIVWVNPATDSSLVDWLKRGAPSEESRRLSAFDPSQP